MCLRLSQGQTWAWSAGREDLSLAALGVTTSSGMAAAGGSGAGGWDHIYKLDGKTEAVATIALASASLGVFRDAPGTCSPPCEGHQGSWGLWVAQAFLTIPFSHPVLVSLTNHQDGSISEEEDRKNIRSHKDSSQVSPGPLAPCSCTPWT